MLDEGVFDHLEARLYPDWLGVKCNRALVPAVREFLTKIGKVIIANER
jgi:hypothetical protein